ncbi:MAG: hypothetical protein JW779_08960 [Candidatus Thorarchaeota archaeon]|nr:hypothetical protein [Candidatus Thorarchaeota archaeon]
MGRSRFALPVIFSIVGIALTILSIYQVTMDLPSTGFFSFIEGTLYTDIVVVLVIAIPVLLLEYFVVAIPLAAIFLLANRFIKAAAYETNIMQIGSKFSGIRMIRRAAAPALFSVSTAGIVRGFFRDFLFTEIGPFDPPIIEVLFGISATLMASLVIMPIALALFMPTWILNDAGIVTHLRQSQLDVRQCPDTEGVGRWYSSMLGGYSILAFPIAMFSQHFLQPFILGGAEPDFISLFISFLWTAGIPLLVMSFIVPIVILNERFQTKSAGIIQRLAGTLGADIVQKPVIAKILSEQSTADERSD